MNRIHQEELDWGKIYGQSWQDDGLYYYDDEPFTGIMYDSIEDIVIEEVELVDGLAHGMSRCWNDKGELVFEGAYKKGYPIGIHKYWHDGNTLHKEVHYAEHNVVLKEVVYNES